MSYAKAITGTRDRLSTGPGGAGFLVGPTTQLISARFPQPRQWVITVMQPVRGDSGVNPWISTFDGGAYPPVGGDIMTAPQLPVLAAMQLRLRWGAGGVSFETAFDYPLSGGVFGVTADVLDLNVGFRGTPPDYATAGEVPVVGAFMVPGIASDPTPLRWRELDPTGATGFTTIANGSDAFWAVKPYTRRIRVASPDVTVRWLVDFLDVAGATLWSERYNLAGIGDFREIVVPCGAAVMRIVNNGAAPAAFTLEWLMGLV